LGMAIISYVLGRRTAGDNLLSIDGWRRLGVPRFLVTMVFIASAAFIFFAAFLIHATGLSLDHATCTFGVISCIALYALTKLCIYAFLIEKVWIVWTPRLHTGFRPSRWKSTSYRACMMALSPFFLILMLLIIGRTATIRSDGVCVIGAKEWALVPLLAFDLFITLSLTASFVYPLTRGDILSPRLRRVASRTFVASAVALITSAINLTVISAMHGRQLGWACLTSCGTDVTFNALVIFWVTGGTSASSHPPAYRSSQDYATTPKQRSKPPSAGSPRKPPANLEARTLDWDVDDDEDMDGIETHWRVRTRDGRDKEVSTYQAKKYDREFGAVREEEEEEEDSDARSVEVQETKMDLKSSKVPHPTPPRSPPRARIASSSMDSPSLPSPHPLIQRSSSLSTPTYPFLPYQSPPPPPPHPSPTSDTPPTPPLEP